MTCGPTSLHPPPRPPHRVWQAGEGQGAQAESREPAKPELRGSQSVYSVSRFDWIPRLENANCHIGFLDFPILKHEQMLNSAQLSASLLLPCLYTQLNTNSPGHNLTYNAELKILAQIQS